MTPSSTRHDDTLQRRGGCAAREGSCSVRCGRRDAAVRDSPRATRRDARYEKGSCRVRSIVVGALAAIVTEVRHGRARALTAASARVASHGNRRTTARSQGARERRLVVTPAGSRVLCTCNVIARTIRWRSSGDAQPPRPSLSKTRMRSPRSTRPRAAAAASSTRASSSERQPNRDLDARLDLEHRGPWRLGQPRRALQCRSEGSD